MDKPLVGEALMKKARENSSKPEDEIATACGYIDSNGIILRKEFYRALVEAKGLRLNKQTDDTQRSKFKSTMDVNNKLKEKIGGLIESQLCINDGDKILLLLFEGYNECLQEIQLKDHKHDNSQFFIEDFGEPVVIGCYFYLPNDQNKLKEYCLKGPFDKWIIECDEEYVEIVKEKKHLVPIQPSYYEVKYPDGYNNGSYEDVYQKTNNRYLKIDGNQEYHWGNDNFTVYTAIENLIRAIYINSESHQKYEIIELGSQPMSKLKEMKIIDAEATLG